MAEARASWDELVPLRPEKILSLNTYQPLPVVTDHEAKSRKTCNGVCGPCLISAVLRDVGGSQAYKMDCKPGRSCPGLGVQMCELPWGRHLLGLKRGWVSEGSA